MAEETDDSSERTHIFRSRFVDILNPIKPQTREKRRLVAGNYRDKEAESIAAKSPTTQRFALIHIRSLAACHDHMHPFTKYIS